MFAINNNLQLHPCALIADINWLWARAQSYHRDRVQIGGVEWHQAPPVHAASQADALLGDAASAGGTMRASAFALIVAQANITSTSTRTGTGPVRRWHAPNQSLLPATSASRVGVNRGVRAAAFTT